MILMKKFYLLLGLIFGFYAAPGQGSQPGLSIDQNGVTRRASLFLPSDYSADKTWPLVINFHGYTGDPEQHIAVTGMNALAEEAGFLIVYPQGLEVEPGFISNPFLPAKAPGWNIGGSLSEYDDIDFVSRLIDRIEENYNIDPARIYVCGMSMGGMMAYYVACQLSDQIAAVAAVAGEIPKMPGGLYDCEPSRPIPVLHFHGTDDILVLYNNLENNPGLGALGTVQFWVNNNECNSDQETQDLPDLDTEDESTVTSIYYSDCADDTEVLLYRINQGRHSWPGSDFPVPNNAAVIIVGKPNQDVNASAEILEFFDRHRLPESLTAFKTILPSEINLRVFPNPFHDQLQFEFTLKNPAAVQLTLFNALGQPVQNVIETRIGAGFHRVDWQPPAGQVPAGLYFYRLQVEEQLVSGSVLWQGR